VGWAQGGVAQGGAADGGVSGGPHGGGIVRRHPTRGSCADLANAPNPGHT
jgi:hypothetical protein